jgi:carbamoyl-phosphate synthase small subunit
MESGKVWVEGYIVRECQDYPSNYRSQITLGEFLRKQNVVGIEGIDTRFLTRKLRSEGAQPGIISTEDFNTESLLEKIRSDRGILGIDLAGEVTCGEAYDFYEGAWVRGAGYRKDLQDPRFKVVALDFGIKTNILRMLSERGIACRVMPAKTMAFEILKEKPDGVLLSNGPGDPGACTYAADAIRAIAKQRPDLPVMGICLGHQILGHTFGGHTVKLKFGHHGANHPVMDMASRNVEITSQNHNFAVPLEYFDDPEFPMRLTHLNLNDNTCEGMIHKQLPVFSIQYHPEASPGPHDSGYLFNKFVQLMEAKKIGGL